ncbi:TetR family transcriptional regulator [Paenibacillus wynnii]|uniref:TetR family transcriptional regulator n=1 Tax=Paenibacillus wynnii TaxID=268407 RepID=A0A098ME62_9BACL|nr:TetR family transcriptional regulator [Paenibacillus wynnii]KGE20338.1 TetR family transcriptional regulator [Paenibacillus wynnii]
MNKQSSFLSKTEILDAAEQTLRRFGPDKTSVTDVAKLLGVSHGTLYRHFPSKAALREAVTERWLEEKIIAPLIVIASNESESEMPLQQVRQYILKLIELKQSYAEEDREMFKMYASVTADAVDLIETHIERIVKHMALIISRGLDVKNIRRISEPETMARSILQATARFHHPAHAYEWQPPRTLEDFNNLWLLIEQGLAV